MNFYFSFPVALDSIIHQKNNKGFTLAELLIVVAIIAVLVAVAIPVFTSQLEKSKEATDLANIRSLYAEQVTAYLDTNAAVANKTYTLKSDTSSVVTAATKVAGISSDDLLNKATCVIGVEADGTIKINGTTASGSAAD